MNGSAVSTLPRTVALVGLMGAGKSSIGRRLAQRLKVPFIDADSEIESAAGVSIEEIFERHGEAAFRDGERHHENSDTDQNDFSHVCPNSCATIG
jgi:shikimate kinase